MSKQFGLSKEELDELSFEFSFKEKDLRYLIPLPIEGLKAKTEMFNDETIHEAVCIDTETTGFDEDDEIISLSWVRFFFNDSMTQIGFRDCGTVYNEPSKPISEEITELTGLTNEMVEGHQITSSVIDTLFAKSKFIIAHHAKFDRRFVESIHRTEVPWACTVNDLDLSARYGCATRSLGSVMAQAFGFYMDHHDSLADSFACYVIARDNFSELVGKAFRPIVRAQAFGTDYDMNDELKANKFRWNSSEKCWYKDVSESEFDKTKKFVNSLGALCVSKIIDPVERYRT